MKQAEATQPLIASQEPADAALIKAVLGGDVSVFESLIARYQPRIFGTVRRYARRESEVEDIVQEIFVKAFQKLSSFRGDAPFEHWLMRLAVRTCYDFLREHQRNREHSVSDLAADDSGFLERAGGHTVSSDRPAAAQALVEAVLAQLSPAARTIITLLEIEDRSVKEIAELTGWSQTLVKVRAFRARAEMKKALSRIDANKYL